MTDRISGGCKCGLIRYSGLRLDAAMFKCHCRDCQQLTGSGHSNMLPLALGSFSISEACTIFEMSGGSGRSTFSGFCPNCGSQLMRRSERMSDRVYVHAASLDNPEDFVSEKSIWTDAVQPWDAASVIKG